MVNSVSLIFMALTLLTILLCCSFHITDVSFSLSYNLETELVTRVCILFITNVTIFSFSPL